MAFVTSVFRAQKAVAKRLDAELAQCRLNHARYEVLGLLVFSQKGASRSDGSKRECNCLQGARRRMRMRWSAKAWSRAWGRRRRPHDVGELARQVDVCTPGDSEPQQRSTTRSRPDQRGTDLAFELLANVRGFSFWRDPLPCKSPANQALGELAKFGIISPGKVRRDLLILRYGAASRPGGDRHSCLRSRQYRNSRRGPRGDRAGAPHPHPSRDIGELRRPHRSNHPSACHRI